jgi:hypothetical protein
VSLRKQLLATAEQFRTLSGPTFADIRHQITIRTRVWSGSYVRDGSATDTDLVLPAHYPIRNVNTAEVSASGGTYTLEDLLVNHITPYDGVSVGYTDDQLCPPVADNRTEIIYRITNSDGTFKGEYSLVALRWPRPFTKQLVLRRRLTTP